MSNISKTDLNDRVLNEAEYMLETKKTIREIAKQFSVSKSTVHIDLNKRLKNINYDLYKKIKKILIYHLEIRHIRGGESTRKKYENLV